MFCYDLAVLYTFHITVHVRPESDSRLIMVMLHGVRVETLTVSPESLGVPFPVSFEAAATVLKNLPRFFFGPEGSFVWVASDNGELIWQVDGQLYDLQERVIYVKLKGSCPASRI